MEVGDIELEGDASGLNGDAAFDLLLWGRKGERGKGEVTRGSRQVAGREATYGHSVHGTGNASLVSLEEATTSD